MKDIMKWTNGFTYEELLSRRERWHNWFAWYPVTIGAVDGRKIKMWWETVMRKGTYTAYPGDCYWTWKYKAKCQWKT